MVISVSLFAQSDEVSLSGQIIDQETKEVIRQIPSEEALNISRTVEEVNSLLFNDIKA